MRCMAFYKIIFALQLGCASFTLMAQSGNTSVKNNRHFIFYGGIGPSYYFNNLVTGKDEVNELGYSVVGRFMWEPEYRLSLGFETGYFQLYSADYNKGPDKAHIKNIAIPIQLVISMKFLKNYYCNFSMGQSILLNKVTASVAGDFNASVVSLGDFGATVGYRRPTSERIFVGAEIKGYYSAKLDDKNIALAFMAGYRF
jgi:hypothetical protein